MMSLVPHLPSCLLLLPSLSPSQSRNCCHLASSRGPFFKYQTRQISTQSRYLGNLRKQAPVGPSSKRDILGSNFLIVEKLQVKEMSKKGLSYMKCKPKGPLVWPDNSPWTAATWTISPWTNLSLTVCPIQFPLGQLPPQTITPETASPPED